MNKPSFPFSAILISLVVLACLVAQFLVAEGAFDLVGRGGAYSYIAAFAIESAIAVEALLFAKNQSRVYFLGLVVSFLVSGTYNFTLVDKAAVELGWFAVGALALGPLFALATVSLALGDVFFAYDERVTQWQEEQRRGQAVVEIEAKAKAERQELGDLEYQRTLEREERQQRLASELEQTRLDARLARSLEKSRALVEMGGVKRVSGTGTGKERSQKDGTHKERAFAILDDTPNVTGVKLARALGVSESYGRKLRLKWRAGKNGDSPVQTF